MPARTHPNTRSYAPAPGDRVGRLIAAIGLVLIAAACTQTKSFVSGTGGPEISGTARVLLMPSDVAVSELTTAGLLEPNAAWTASAKINVETALDTLLRQRNARLVPYRSATGDDNIDPTHLQAFKLHEAVGAAILLHKYAPTMALPTERQVRLEHGRGGHGSAPFVQC